MQQKPTHYKAIILQLKKLKNIFFKMVLILGEWNSKMLVDLEL